MIALAPWIPFLTTGVENQIHRVRKQKNILLPSGGRRIDFYRNPEKYGGKDRIITVPADTINELLAQYDKPDLLLFGSREQVTWCEEIHTAIGTEIECEGGMEYIFEDDYLLH